MTDYIEAQTSMYPDESGAIISECENYRYRLWRVWDNAHPRVLFIMLNPSTADASEDDPTIRRCIGFAKSWGYGGLMVGNLFAFRTPYPKELKTVVSHKTYINSIHIEAMMSECDVTICAWGNPPIQAPRYPFMNKKVLHCLALTNSNNPRHPLYLKKDLRPVLFSPNHPYLN